MEERNAEHRQIDRNRYPNDGDSFFRPSDAQQHCIATIPEGSTVRETALPERIDKSPSPEHSSGQTTGTTTTPTSCENAISSDDAHDRDGGPPEFPRQSIQNASPWRGRPMYSPNRLPSVRQSDQYVQVNEGFIHTQLASSSPSQRHNPAYYPSAIKVLVSNNVAGSIIGRAGQTISELQEQSRTRIKLSQASDFFPGTQDRVCLVQGETENVKVAVHLLLERLFVLQEHQHTQHMAWQIQRQRDESQIAFDFVIRILVPTTCCGMIIGKSGSNIKYLEEATGVTSVRLSPKDAIDAGFATSIAVATNERIVTVTCPRLEACVQCVCLIAESMAAHPEISRYANMTTSYTRIMSDPFIATGARPSAHIAPVQPRHLTPQERWELLEMSPYGPAAGMQRRIASSPDLGGVLHSHLLQHPHQRPILNPATPDRSGVFNQGVHSGVPYQSTGSDHGAPSYLPLDATMQPSNRSARHVVDMVPPGVVGGHHLPHSHSSPGLLSFHIEQSLHISNPSLTSSSHLQQEQPSDGNLESFVPQAPTMTSPGCFVAQVLVPEAMIGSILGRAGRSLTDLQNHSRTRIRVSQRGEYMLGTRSRIVNIRGESAQSVWYAQYLMSQCLVVPTTAPPVLQPVGQPMPMFQQPFYVPLAGPESPQNVVLIPHASSDDTPPHDAAESSSTPAAGQ